MKKNLLHKKMSKNFQIFYKLLAIALCFGFTGHSTAQTILEEGFENGGSIPAGWTQEYVSGTHDWVFQNGDDNALSAYSGSYNAAFTHVSNGDATKLITPPLDLSAYDSPELEFWHAQEVWYGDQDELRVYYKTSSGGSWTQIPGAEWTSNIDSWTKETLSLPNKSSDYYIAFEATDGYGYGVVIDEVKITGVDPNAPGELTNASPAGNEDSIALSGALTWDFGANSETYDVWFGEKGNMSEVVSGATVSGGSGSYSYSGLGSEKEYEWQIIVHNSAKATRNGPVWSFTSAMQTQNAPFFEDFETNLNHWSIDGTETIPQITSVIAYEGSQSLDFNYAPTESSSITLQMDSVANPVMTFWYYFTYYGSTDLSVDIKEAGASTWIEEIWIDTVGYDEEYQWIKAVVDLNEYGTSDTFQIRITAETISTGSYNIYMDSVYIAGGYPSKPTNPSPPVDTINQPLNGNLTWDFGELTDSYDLWFGKAGNMTKVVTNAPSGATGSYSYTASHSENYQWQVICHNAEKSTEGPVWTFSTIPDTITSFPYFQGFEAWKDNPINAPQHWSNISATGHHWIQTTGFYDDHLDEIYEGDSAIIFNSRNSNYFDKSAEMVSPPMDLSSLTNPVVEFFWWHQDNESDPAVISLLTTTDGENYTEIDNFNAEASGGYEDGSWIDDWSEYDHLIGTDVTRLKIRIDGGSYDDNNTYIDAFSIKEAAPEITVSDDTVFFDLVNMNEATEEFTLEITNSGAGSGTLDITDITISGTNADDFTHSGSTTASLLEDETLDCTVSCTPNTSGDLTATLDITYNAGKDVCQVVLIGSAYDPYFTAFPYEQDFDTVPEYDLPQDWTYYNDLSNIYTYVETDQDQCHSSPNSVEMDNANVNTGNFMLISPPTELSVDGTWIKFWSMHTGSHSDFYVGTLSDPENPATFTPVDTISPTGTFEQYIIDIPGTKGITYVAFKHSLEEDNSLIRIDDFLWEIKPSCPQPAELSASSLSSTSTNLSWDETGSAANWDIEIGNAGFSPTGTPTHNDITANPYKCSGLTPGKHYDWYVRSDCGGETSEWTGPHTFTSFPKTPPANGDGSQSSPYEIASLENLYWLSHSDSVWDKNFIQTANIDTVNSGISLWDDGKGFSPIGYDYNEFKGNYNGKRHVINNLYINRPNEDYLGVFGHTDYAEIDSLGVTNIYINSDGYAGAIAGRNENSVIRKCFSTGVVQGVSGSYQIGGLVGTNYSSSIYNSYTTATVDGDAYCGGVAGSQYYGTIENVFCTGSVSGNSDVGGVIGFAGSGSDVNNTFWNTTTSGQSTSDGGTGKTTTQLKDTATFTDLSTSGLDAAWDFVNNPNDDTGNDDIWNISPSMNNGYPYLSWQSFVFSVDGDWTGTDSTDHVIIDGCTITIQSTKDVADCYDLTIKPDGSLTINGTLDVRNELTIESDATSTGSLINNGTMIVDNKINVQQFLPENNQNYNWHYLSQPIKNVDAVVFPGVDPGSGTTYYAYEWDEPSDQWVGITDPATKLDSMKGYAIPVDVASIVEFTGDTLFSEAMTTPNLSHSNGNQYAGYNLVGNPYTAAYNADNLQGTNWTQDIWVRDDGNFQTHNVAGGTGTLTGDAIPAMQGFWVKMNAGGGTIEFDPANLLHHATSVYKNTGNELCISLSNQSLSDKSIIYFHENAKNAFDAYDSEKRFAVMNDYPQIYSLVEGEELAINGMSLQVENSWVVKLGLKANKPGMYTIEAGEINEFTTYEFVYLLDNTNNTVVDLRKEQEYSFDLTHPTNSNSRFELIFSKQPNHMAETELNGINVFANNQSVYIKTGKELDAKISIRDMAGKVIHKERMYLNKGINKVKLSRLVTGIYFVTVNTRETIENKKVILR